ncbi:hypothetical protein [Aeromicrobium sp. REDSEA-S32_B7]|uniref:hypothetical protein n=1 Tax=Aeromicrobium sp. REDSEA-S32_B7 TaxID=1811526 RepID=UPI002955B8E3|nr:hypothetical protein [Aeromicrobium sp. REDSEA-S32_B7]
MRSPSRDDDDGARPDVVGAGAVCSRGAWGQRSAQAGFQPSTSSALRSDGPT